MPETFLRLVRMPVALISMYQISQSRYAPCPEKRKQCRKQEGRCNQHQRDRRIVSQRGSQRREVRVERQSNDFRRQHERQPPHLPVCNGKPESVHLTSSLLLITYTYILFHSLDGKRPLLRREPLGCRRKVWKDEDGNSSKENS